MQTRERARWTPVALVLPLLVAACDDEADDAADANAADAMLAADAALPDEGLADMSPPEAPPPIDLVGVYHDDFDTPHRVSADAWSQGPAESASLTTFTRVDNTARTAVGQNAADAPFNAGKWSRFDYTFTGGGVWYCQAAFDADDEAGALAATVSDPADPATGGCNGFAWSRLTPATAPASLGAFTDDFDTPYEIAETVIVVGVDEMASRFVLTDVDTAHAIARNADDNPFNPGAWSRFDFATVGDVLYVCQSTYDAPDAATARAASADASDPATGGCGMFAWSVLTPVE